MLRLRNNIFETNSSTTHSLTIARNKVTPEVIEKFKKENGTHIIFGLNKYEDIEKVLWDDPSIDENTPFQIKADILYFSMYVWTDCYSIRQYILDKKLLTSKLEELGFTVEFREEDDILKDYSNTYDLDDNEFVNMYHNIDEVIDYLFGNHVLYYSWCDEEGMEFPESIEEALHRFAEYERSGEEMERHYNR